MAPYLRQPVAAALDVFNFVYLLCLRTLYSHTLQFESIRKHWIIVIFILAFLIGNLDAVTTPANADAVIYSREQLGTSAYINIFCTKNGNSAGVKRRLNVRSLGNKTEKLTALVRTQWGYRECSFVCFYRDMAE